MERAELDWTEDGAPVSRRHGDIYYSRRDGLAETHHVFLDGCDIHALWAPDRMLVVGEIGFGTGLNLLALWQAWQGAGCPSRLLFFSTELHPLGADDLARAHARFPQLAPLAAQLRAALPPPVPGLHSRFLAEGVELQLWLGDAAAGLAQWQGRADAWFLDGFAPASAPDLWSPALMQRIAARSRPGARIASFSVARPVRDALEGAGFAVTRRPGIQGKRQVLAGRLETPSPAELPAATGPVWARLPPPAMRPQTALVLGAGLAGAWAAHALAEAGVSVTVLDPAPRAAAGPSGNAVALFAPRLVEGAGAESQLFARCFLHAEAKLQRLGIVPAGPVLQRLDSPAALARAEKLVARQPLGPDRLRLLSREDAQVLAGMPLREGTWLQLPGGAVAPAEIVVRLLEHPRITLHLGQSPAAPQWRDGLWHVGPHAAPLLVLAAGLDVPALAPEAGLTLRPAAGHLAVTAAPGAPACVVQDEGWILPALGGVHGFGATWEGPALAEAGAAAQALAALHPQGALPEGTRLEGGVRATVADHLPLAGPLADMAAVLAAHPQWVHGAAWPPDRAVPWLPGLFALTGLGARGTVLAPLAARLVAAQALGAPWPLEPELAARLAPMRVPLRAAQRQRNSG